MSSIAREMVGATGMAVSLGLGVLIQISGMLALFGGSLRVPGVLLDGQEVQFTAAESLLDSLKFFADQPLLIPIAFIAGALLFKPGGGMNGGPPHEAGSSEASAGGDNPPEGGASFREMADQLR